MKAVLIIEVDDNTDFTKAKANITMAEDEYGILLGNVKKKWYKDIPLRPMKKYNELMERIHRLEEEYFGESNISN